MSPELREKMIKAASQSSETNYGLDTSGFNSGFREGVQAVLQLLGEFDETVLAEENNCLCEKCTQYFHQHIKCIYLNERYSFVQGARRQHAEMIKKLRGK